MNKEKLVLLKKYLELGLFSLLIQNKYMDYFDNSVIINADIDRCELNGHYENLKYCPPSWYEELVKKSTLSPVVLIINNIDKISLIEQTKFIEILKYKKISTFNLPGNCIVVVTYSNLDGNKINEEVYSLLVKI